MISRDYLKEVGLPSQKKTVPRFVAVGVLAVVAVGLCIGIAGVVRQTKEHHAAEKPLPPPAAAAEAVPNPVPTAPAAATAGEQPAPAANAAPTETPAPTKP